MSEKTCSEKKNPLSPCYMTDGSISLDSTGKCITCGRTQEEIEKKPDPVVKKPIEEVATPEQMVDINKLRREVSIMKEAMKQRLTECVLSGKTGWNKTPPWVFKNNIEAKLATLSNENTDVKTACVDIANYAMFIFRSV